MLKKPGSIDLGESPSSSLYLESKIMYLMIGKNYQNIVRK